MAKQTGNKLEEESLESLGAAIYQGASVEGTERGFENAVAFLRNFSGKLFSDGKDEEAKVCRNYAEMLKEEAPKSSKHSAASSGAAMAELKRRDGQNPGFKSPAPAEDASGGPKVEEL